MSTTMDFTRYGSQGNGHYPSQAELSAVAAQDRDGRAATRYEAADIGREHLIRRLPNRQWVHFGISLVNLYLRRSGSVWRLWARYRCPIAGQRYGPYGALKSEHATKVAVYLKRTRTAV